MDVRQSARQTNIRAEQVELLPKGRDFTTLVTQAPGANNEAKLGGLSIDGASAGENRYIIDGIETTDARVARPARTSSRTSSKRSRSSRAATRRSSAAPPAA